MLSACNQLRAIVALAPSMNGDGLEAGTLAQAVEQLVPIESCQRYVNLNKVCEFADPGRQVVDATGDHQVAEEPWRRVQCVKK